MRKITIEFDEKESIRLVMMTTDQILRECEPRTKPDQNIRIRLDKGLMTGALSQRGNFIAIMGRK